MHMGWIFLAIDSPPIMFMVAPRCIGENADKVQKAPLAKSFSCALS